MGFSCVSGNRWPVRKVTLVLWCVGSLCHACSPVEALSDTAAAPTQEAQETRRVADLESKLKHLERQVMALNDSQAALSQQLERMKRAQEKAKVRNQTKGQTGIIRGLTFAEAVKAAEIELGPPTDFERDFDEDAEQRMAKVHQRARLIQRYRNEALEHEAEVTGKVFIPLEPLREAESMPTPSPTPSPKPQRLRDKFREKFSG